MLALRAFIAIRRGDLIAAQADAQAAIELAPDLLGTEFVVLAVSAAVLAGLERDETPESLRRLIDAPASATTPSSRPARSCGYASGVLRAAAGNHEAADRGAAGLRARPSGLRRREPGGAAVALRGGALAGRGRPPRGGARPGRRRAAPRADVRRAARDRHRAARRAPRRSRAGERAELLNQALAMLAPSRPASSTPGCSSTSARRSARPDSGPRRGSRCSKGSPWRRAAAAGPGAPGAGRAGGDRRPAAHDRPLRRRLADPQRAARGRARRRRAAPTARSPRRCSSPRRRSRPTWVARFASSTSPRGASSPTCSRELPVAPHELAAPPGWRTSDCGANSVMYGLRSRTGVPLIASRPRTVSVVPSMPSSSQRLTPSRFGRRFARCA